MKVILYGKMKDKKKMQMYLRNHLKDRGKHQREATNRRMTQLQEIFGGTTLKKKEIDSI